ncbi:MAG TPA: 3-dehydroquinate synthase [Candidatus Azoamicus sp. OHIO2]
MYKVIKQIFQIKFEYNIFFTENIFDIKNKVLINVFINSCNKKTKAILFVDKKILLLNKKLEQNIINYFKFFEKDVFLVCHPVVICGGERLKNRFLFLKIFYSLLDKYKICRQSYIISLGGGSLQDFIGYLSATTHRGIKLIRIPTTVLSQDDSGVGVKNGINYNGKKNFIGSFSVPHTVINDCNFLSSLDNENFIEGFSEAIKVALINDAALFYLIEHNAEQLLLRNSVYVKDVIYQCAKLHAEHIAKYGDPFESLSSRPLDFGHWAAHKIESMSNYNISHGKSVAIGIIMDCTYSYFIGILQRAIWKKIFFLFIKLKFKIYVKELSVLKNNFYQIFDGLEEFREHLGGKLTITLITDIGVKIDIHHINILVYKKVIKFLKKIHTTIK